MFPSSLHGRVLFPGLLFAGGYWRGFNRGWIELARLERASAEDLRRYRAQRLRGIVDYARQRSQFYGRTLGSHSLLDGTDEELQALPFLDRSDLQRAFSELQAFPRPARIHKKTTGGSTGQAVTVLKDAIAIGRELGATWRALGWYGVDRGDSWVRVWGNPSVSRRWLRARIADIATNRITLGAFGFDTGTLERYWHRLLRVRPRFIYGYASMVSELARHILAEGHDASSLRLKVVVTTSEVLLESDRRDIEAAFRCPVRNEYGCGEVGAIAYECEHSSLHVMASNILVEVLRPNGSEASVGESGDVVVTDLGNRAMPLIRYRIGDRAEVAGPCRCGRALPAIAAVWGRAYDFITGPDGRRYHGEYLMYLFEDLRKAGHAFDQFQVIQLSRTEIRVRLVGATADLANLTPVLRAEFARRLPGVAVHLEVVDAIPREASGKIRLIRGLPQSGN